MIWKNLVPYLVWLLAVLGLWCTREIGAKSHNPKYYGLI
jgi:hypothetical protein